MNTQLALFPTSHSKAWLMSKTVALVATHCCACGHALVDARSVERGIGPICWKKLGQETEGLDEETRKTVNKLMYRASLAWSAGEVDKTRELAVQIHDAGAPACARRIAANAGSVVIEVNVEGTKIVVKSPYNDKFIAETRALPGRFYIKKEKATEFGLSAKAALWTAIQNAFKGAILMSKKGARTI